MKDTLDEYNTQKKYIHPCKRPWRLVAEDPSTKKERALPFRDVEVNSLSILAPEDCGFGMPPRGPTLQ
jgi:hypothetical protein